MNKGEEDLLVNILLGVTFACAIGVGGIAGFLAHALFGG